MLLQKMGREQMQLITQTGLFQYIVHRNLIRYFLNAGLLKKKIQSLLNLGVP